MSAFVQDEAEAEEKEVVEDEEVDADTETFKVEGSLLTWNTGRWLKKKAEFERHTIDVDMFYTASLFKHGSFCCMPTQQKIEKFGSKAPFQMVRCEFNATRGLTCANHFETYKAQTTTEQRMELLMELIKQDGCEERKNYALLKGAELWTTKQSLKNLEVAETAESVAKSVKQTTNAFLVTKQHKEEVMIASATSIREDMARMNLGNSTPLLQNTTTPKVKLIAGPKKSLTPEQKLKQRMAGIKALPAPNEAAVPAPNEPAVHAPNNSAFPAFEAEASPVTEPTNRAEALKLVSNNKEFVKLTKDNTNLRAKVTLLEDENDKLRKKLASVEQQNEELEHRVCALMECSQQSDDMMETDEKDQRIAELEQRLHQFEVTQPHSAEHKQFQHESQEEDLLDYCE